MIELASVAAGASVAGVLLALMPGSKVARRLARFDLAPAHRHRGLSAMGWRAAAAAAVAGAVWIAIGPMIALLLGYAAWVAPSLAADRRAARDRASLTVATSVLVERLEALASAGRPVEAAFARLADRPSGSKALDRALDDAVRAYQLGAPLIRALASGSRAAGASALARFADELDRARDLGTGSLAAIRDAREEARAAERSRAIDAASRVDAQLMLVVVLCYMPALMLVVVIPLFLGLLGGLFGG